MIPAWLGLCFKKPLGARKNHQTQKKEASTGHLAEDPIQ